MIRLILAIWVARVISFLTTTFKIGGGSAAPGLYALKVDPELVRKLAKQIPQNIVITGTNGKTTTARLLHHLVASQKVTTIRNATGSNLERGIASALLEKVSLLGKISEVQVGIWELDEAAFNSVVFKLRPELMVFLNAFRDQLDRYGEVDSVRSKWWNSLLKVDWNTHMLINEGDPTVATLEEVTEENKRITASFFKLRGHKNFAEATIKDPLNSDRADFEAKIIKNRGLSGSDVEVLYPGGRFTMHFQVPGNYQIYNLLAAFSVYYALNLPIEHIEELLTDFSPAFGRVEKVSIKGVECYIFLIKNPAGANNVFETISGEIGKDDVLLAALNDNFADGKDVSWIWDADFEQLVTQSKLPRTMSHEPSNTLIVSGRRAQDLGVRFKYAGFGTKGILIENDFNRALELALDSQPKRLFILPTYTALLQLQRHLAEMGVKKEYWKES